jgi:uncharacterized damage-inducible protein DinB
MPCHPLVAQLRFARSEFIRCLEGVSVEDAVRRILPMNSLSWIVGHLANQEQGWWLFLAQGKLLVPGLNERVGYRKPASTPPLEEMWAAWHTITQAADPYLDSLTAETLLTHLMHKGVPRPENVGTMMLRNCYHYWYHTGEAHAIRDMLGHQDVPEFVGDMSQALYRGEA